MEKTNGLGVPLKHCQTINHFLRKKYILFSIVFQFLLWWLTRSRHSISISQTSDSIWPPNYQCPSCSYFSVDLNCQNCCLTVALWEMWKPHCVSVCGLFWVVHVLSSGQAAPFWISTLQGGAGSSFPVISVPHTTGRNQESLWVPLAIQKPHPFRFWLYSEF